LVLEIDGVGELVATYEPPSWSADHTDAHREGTYQPRYATNPDQEKFQIRFKALDFDFEIGQCLLHPVSDPARSHPQWMKHGIGVRQLPQNFKGSCENGCQRGQSLLETLQAGKLAVHFVEVKLFFDVNTKDTIGLKSG
jgi:hypothetical protein